MVNKLRIYKKIKEELSKKEIHYLNMEEKIKLIKRGEHVPICVNYKKSKPINTGPVKYYSKYPRKKMKI